MDYTEGNMSNKGGRFVPELNYVCNFSFSLNLDSDKIVFEKGPEGSTQSKKIPHNTKGLYLDGQEGHFAVDPVRKEIRMRVKLLQNAKPGHWYLSGYSAVNLNDGSKERFSNFVTSPVLVSRSKQGNSKHGLIVASVVILLVSIGCYAFFGRRKKIADEPVELPENLKSVSNALRLYVEQHLNGKVTAQDVLNSLSISEALLRKLLKHNKSETFPEYVNFVKIEKAKLLLESTNQGISEIGYALGYDNINYFNRIFKKSEACTPKEYRLKTLKR